MSDTQVTIIGFLLGAAVFVGYAIRLGLLRLRPGGRPPESDDEEAPPMAGPRSTDLDSSTKEVKPISGSMQDRRTGSASAQGQSTTSADRIKTS